MKPGIYHNIPEAQYRAIDAMNYSRIKLLSKSVELFKWRETHPISATPEMDFGRIVDALLHEPDAFKERFAVAPECDRRTKAGKEAYAAFEASAAGKECVKADDYQRAVAAVEAVHLHAIASQLYTSGKPQVCIVWNDRETGVLCKGRIDWLTASAICDCKTAKTVDPKPFASQMYELGYHIQSAFYQDGLYELTGNRLPFTFVAVESQPPHRVKTFSPDKYTIQAGRQAYRRGLYAYSLCNKIDTWRDNEYLEEIQLPMWALKEEGIEPEPAHLAF